MLKTQWDGSLAKLLRIVSWIALAALLSVAAFAYCDGWMGVSAEGHDAQTRAYVDGAVEYYADRGLGKTVERYGNPLSWEGGRYLIVADAHTHVLVSSPLLYLNGRGVDALVPGGELGGEIEKATGTGHWFDSVGLNMLSGEMEPARYFVRLDDGLAFMSARFSGGLDTPLPDPPPAAEPDDDALTKAYVERAWEYYEANGLETTVERYSDPASRQGERHLFLLDPESYAILATVVVPLRGSRFTTFAPGGPFAGELERATEEGHWIDGLTTNLTTGQQEPTRIFVIVRDGLAFMSTHFVVRENVEDTTKEYVANAIALYDRDGLDAMVEYYNSRESMDGQFYLFMMDENDIYLVHPVFPRLIGTDIKDVVGSDGQELGREIARATEEGIWVEYLWPNPVTLDEESKVTWAIRHDGKIFASGYYTGREEAGPPPWVGADPIEYTVEYVNRAIERYEEFGLESVKAYYNSVASFEGEWYLFATDENDIYVIHPLFSRLIGTDIKDVVGSDGYELGKEIAKATEEGHWIEYLWPHPVTLSEAPKVSYAKRHDGYMFASGYYPETEDPAAYTKSYTQKAIEMYEREGFEATVAHYNSRDSVEGQWSMVIIGEDGKIVSHAQLPGLLGTEAEDYVSTYGFNVGEAMLKAPEDGYWFQITFATPRASGDIQMNVWAIRHDGLIFSSGYFAEQGSPLPDAGD